MDYIVIEEVTKELLALSPEELRSFIDGARKGEVAHLLLKGGFISARGEENLTYPDHELLYEHTPSKTIAFKPRMKIVIEGFICTNPESDFSDTYFECAA